MSASLKIGIWVDYLRAAISSPFGRADAPFTTSGGDSADFTTTGALPPVQYSKACASGVETVLWDYDDLPLTPELMVIASDVIGFLFVYVDAETSSTDPSPAGTHRHKYPLGIGCGKPQTITTYQALTIVTASDPTGYSVNPTTLTVGRVYKVSFYPANDEDAVVDFAAFT